MKDPRPTHSHILAQASWEEHDRLGDLHPASEFGKGFVAAMIVWLVVAGATLAWLAL